MRRSTAVTVRWVLVVALALLASCDVGGLKGEPGFGTQKEGQQDHERTSWSVPEAHDDATLSTAVVDQIRNLESQLAIEEDLEERGSFTPLTMAVCMPAIYETYVSCHEAIFHQLNEYHTFPDEFAISLSGVGKANLERGRILDDIEANMRIKYPRVFESTSVIILRTARTRSQGGNRNYAAKNTQSEILLFFDSDDYAHPDRTRIILEEFRSRPQLDVLLHGFVFLEDDQGPDVIREYVRSDMPTRRWAFTYQDIRDAVNTFKDSEWNRRGHRLKCPLDKLEVNSIINPTRKLMHMYANGWPSVRRKVWEEIQFGEGHGHKQIGEDCTFGGQAILAGYNYACLDTALALYNQQTTRCMDY